MTARGGNRDLAARFSRAADAPAEAPPSPASGQRRGSKFTVILAPGDAEDFDAVVLAARRALGRRVDKSEVIRALIRLLTEDDELQRQVRAALQGPPGCETD